MDRLYEPLLLAHLREERQVAFLMGPRQVGKTTTAQQVGAAWSEHVYWTWDHPGHRAILLAGPDRMAEACDLATLRSQPLLLVLDEIHKYAGWKDLLKGFFDTWGGRCRVLVTGSSRLDVFRHGGDSLMGRYFPYRMHPLSAGEILDPTPPEDLLRPLGRQPDPDLLPGLLRHGGFPEPFLRQRDAFTRRWRRTRAAQLFREDLRDLTRIRDLGQVEHLGEVLRHFAGQRVTLTRLATEVRASLDTVRTWLRTLESFYFLFLVRPWHRNIPRALRKEPKAYLWDWSAVPEDGPRCENLVAAALAKSVQLWTDLGRGDFGLWFLRDKAGREVDFLLTRDEQPWMLVEVKQGRGPVSPALAYYQELTGAPHALQVSFALPDVAADCFAGPQPQQVPAGTFLARLA